jgi:hypothetical protein
MPDPAEDTAPECAPLIARYRWRERALMSELHAVEVHLAQALGYAHDPVYGWIIGDHTAVTLAMEVQRRGVMPHTTEGTNGDGQAS